MKVCALYVFWGGSGSTENLINLSVVLRATHLPGDDAQPGASACCTHLVPGLVLGHCPSSRRAAQKSDVAVSLLSLYREARNASDVVEGWHFRRQWSSGSDRAFVKLLI